MCMKRGHPRWAVRQKMNCFNANSLSQRFPLESLQLVSWSLWVGPLFQNNGGPVCTCSNATKILQCHVLGLHNGCVTGLVPDRWEGSLGKSPVLGTWEQHHHAFALPLCSGSSKRPIDVGPQPSLTWTITCPEVHMYFWLTQDYSLIDEGMHKPENDYVQIDSKRCVCWFPRQIGTLHLRCRAFAIFFPPDVL